MWSKYSSLLNGRFPGLGPQKRSGSLPLIRRSSVQSVMSAFRQSRNPVQRQEWGALPIVRSQPKVAAGHLPVVAARLLELKLAGLQFNFLVQAVT